MEDLMASTVRRALNLTEAWLLSVISPEDWDNRYKAILNLTVETAREQRRARAVLAPESADGRGKMVVIREEPKDDAPKRTLNFGSA